jgi:hypothetical protein
LKSVKHITGEIRGEFDDGVIRKYSDGAEVVAAETSLVGEGAHNLSRLNALTLSHFNAIRAHGLAVFTRTTLGTFRAVLTAETFPRSAIIS